MLNQTFAPGLTPARKEILNMLRSRDGHWHYRFEYKGREYTGNTGLAANERERKSAEKLARGAKAQVTRRPFSRRSLLKSLSWTRLLNFVSGW
jgi:hypothetical protein